MLAAAPPPTPFATPHAPTVIKAYACWTAWEDVRGDDLVIKVRSPGGRVTTRPSAATSATATTRWRTSSRSTSAPDTRGRPSIVLTRCAGTGRGACGLRIGRLPDRPSRSIAGTAQEESPWAVTFWHGTLAWSDVHRTLHLRCGAGAPARVVRPFRQPHADVEEAELRGDLLAATLNYDDPTAPEDNAVALALANVRTGHRETLATEQPGEGGQRFTGPTFAGGHTLSWLLTCHGDDGGCSPRFGVYRRDLRTRRTVFARDARQHFGFAALGGDTVLLGPRQSSCFEENRAGGDCRIERRLTFR